MKIKNWSTFQHFKDRRPPWIKLHRDILEQRDISLISDRSFRVLVCLWLLASEDKAMQGNLPSIEDIAFRLRMPEQDIVDAIQELGDFVYQDDIKMISSRYQVDVPETETETETEAEKKKNFTPSFEIPSHIDPAIWDEFIKHRKAMKSPMTDMAKKMLVGRLETLRADGHNSDDLLKTAIMNGWKSVYPAKPETKPIGSKRNERLERELAKPGDQDSGDNCRALPALVYCKETGRF